MSPVLRDVTAYTPQSLDYGHFTEATQSPLIILTGHSHLSVSWNVGISRGSVFEEVAHINKEAMFLQKWAEYRDLGSVYIAKGVLTSFQS